MLKFLIVLLCIALILLLLYIMPIRIKLKTIRKDKDDLIIIRVKTLYGIVNIKFEVPLLDIIFVNNRPALKYKAEVESNRTSKLWKKVTKIFTVDDFNNVKKYFHHDPIFLRMMKEYWSAKLSIYDFSFILKYGMTDAAFAAILYGLAWTVLGTIMALAKNNLNLTIKQMIITPYFDKEIFNIEVSCIIKFKFGDIINTGIMVLKRRSQRRKTEQKLKDNLNVS